MYTYNLTFIVDRKRESDLAAWIDSAAIPALSSPDCSGFRSMKVIDVPGDPEFASQALSVTLQADFEFPAALKEWSETLLPKTVDEFHKIFGRESMIFRSILKSFI